MVASVFQKNIYKVFDNTNKNINISAVAGSGKTTVLLELLNHIPEGKTSLFLAFNNSVVDELKNRITKSGVDVMTLHSCGYRTLCQNGYKVNINKNKSLGKIDRVIKDMPNVTEKQKSWYYFVSTKIIDLMRCNMCENDYDSISMLADRYNINIGDAELEIIKKSFELVVKDKRNIDFADMIYIPVIDDKIRFRKYDYVFCDESQDFSLCQHEFIKKCIGSNGRLVTVGDKRQAIYGFAGADSDSYERLQSVNGKSISMPLSVSYRCSKNVVLEARKIVPEISYSENAIDGVVRNGSLTEIKDGDWVICRNLKPLVETYMWLTKNRVKSVVRGSDIGSGLIALIDKTSAKTIGSLMQRLDNEKDELLHKLENKGIRKPALHPKMEILQQNIDVISVLSEGLTDVESLRRMIRGIFRDDVSGVVLSTIHKAKGLENDRIFFAVPELIPSKYATQEWQLEQEQNLKYVAITRAKSELIYVDQTTFTDDVKNREIKQG